MTDTIDEVTTRSDDTNHIDSNKLIEELIFSSNSIGNDEFQSVNYSYYNSIVSTAGSLVRICRIVMIIASIVL